MSLDDASAVTQKALSALARCRADTHAWNDDRRRQFERGSATRLEHLGRNLLKALRSADERITRAARTLDQ